jgi:hypothetical protein
MIEVRSPVPGGERDILIFEVYLFSEKCLLRNVKMRLSKKTGKPYVVYPCMKVLKDDGQERYPLLAEFEGESREALKTDVLPQLKKLKPEVFSQLC